MPRHYVQGYETNPGGSIVFRDVPVGTTTAYGQRSEAAGLSYLEGPPTTITFSDFLLTIVDTGGVNGGQGSHLIYTFPRGVLQMLGVNVALTIAAGAGLGATAAVVASLGTAAAATDNATLVGTGEATYVASTAATLTGSAGAFTAMNAVAAVAVPIDGRTTEPAMYLNFAVPDAGITANAVLTINGTIKFSWIVT